MTRLRTSPVLSPVEGGWSQFDWHFSLQNSCDILCEPRECDSTRSCEYLCRSTVAKLTAPDIQGTFLAWFFGPAATVCLGIAIRDTNVFVAVLIVQTALQFTLVSIKKLV